MAPQGEILDPHGEERGDAARLEPRGPEVHGLDSTLAECTLEWLKHASVRSDALPENRLPV